MHTAGHERFKCSVSGLARTLAKKMRVLPATLQHSRNPSIPFASVFCPIFSLISSPLPSYFLVLLASILNGCASFQSIFATLMHSLLGLLLVFDRLLIVDKSETMSDKFLKSLEVVFADGHRYGQKRNSSFRLMHFCLGPRMS